MKPETHARLRLPDGRILESAGLSPEERAAYIEFALHLAAPVLARALAEGVLGAEPRSPAEREGPGKPKEAYLDLPENMTLQEVTHFLRLGRSTLYDLCRSGRIPYVRVGTRILVPSKKLIEWMNAGGTEGERDNVGKGVLQRSSARRP